MTTAPATRRAQQPAHTTHRLTLRGAIRSEFVKLWSISTTLITFAATILMVALMSWLAPGPTPGDTQAALAAFTGNMVLFIAVFVSVLAATNITTEHTTGQINLTNTVVPRRAMTVAAKTITIGATMWAVSAIALLVAATTGLIRITQAGDTLSTDVIPTLLASIAGGATAAAAMALISLSIGGVLRHGPFSTAAIFTLMFILPSLSGISDFTSKLAWLLPTASMTALYQPINTEPDAIWRIIALAATVLLALALWTILFIRRANR